MSDLPEEPQDCSDVLEALYLFIDDEIDSANASLIRHHLDECGPCLRQYDLDEAVKALVRRSCHEAAPEQLRLRILTRISEVRVSYDA